MCVGGTPPFGKRSVVPPRNLAGSVVLTDELKCRRPHAELTTPVSLSVYLPLLRILPPIIWAAAHIPFSAHHKK